MYAQHPLSYSSRGPRTDGWKDPKLLYAINGINAYHIEHGKEDCLTPAGPQTLSLLMVPTSSPFADFSSTEPQSQAPDEDFYLHLHLPPELDLPLPATTQIYHQPPNSYLIPRWDLGPDSGAFTRIEFPGVGEGKGCQEDVDTLRPFLLNAQLSWNVPLLQKVHAHGERRARRILFPHMTPLLLSLERRMCQVVLALR